MEEILRTWVAPVKTEVFFSTFGNHTRLEVKNSGLPIGKFTFLFQKLDQQNKQSAIIVHYVPIEEALLLANDILSGGYAKKAMDLKNGSNNIVDVDEFFGSSKTNEKGEPRADGKPYFRCMKLSLGNKWMLKCSSGPGQKTQTGGVVADGKPEIQINVGMDNRTLKKMAIMIKEEYAAYRTAQYIDHVKKEKVSNLPSFESFGG